ncbi:MAG: Signal transduction histidine kinase [Phormidium sp. OSCR]|nr:MAG: Signal transduction histidine kinase [Phormidium sp. OSCR]
MQQPSPQEIIAQQQAQLEELQLQLEVEQQYRELLTQQLATSERQLRGILGAIMDVVLEIEIEAGQIQGIDIAPTHLSALYDAQDYRSDWVNQMISRFFEPEIGEIWLEQIQQVLEEQKRRDFDYDVTIAGEKLWFSAQISPLTKTRVIWVARDISDRKYYSDALQLIVEGTTSETGQEFFDACVRYLAEALQVRYAIVSEFAPKQTRLRSLAYWTGETWHNRLEYDIQGTPCAEVLRGNICYYPNKVAELFPGDRDLQDINAVSYVGIPLYSSTQEILGHLAVIDTKAIPVDQNYEKILKIFAARAGAELERVQAEKALKTSERQYRTLVETANCIILRWDLRGKIKFINQFGADFFGFKVAELVGQPVLGTIVPKQDSSGQNLEDLIAKICQNPNRFLANENENISRDGKQFYISWVNQLTQLGTEAELLSIGTDVSDRKRAEDELARKLKQEKLLNQITYQIRQSLDIHDIFNVAVQEIASVFQVDRCHLQIYQDDPTPDFPQYSDYRRCGYSVCLNQGVWSKESRYVQTLLSQDYALASDSIEDDVLLKETFSAEFNLKSVLSIRTSYQGKANGILSLHQCDRYRHWTKEDIELIESVASRIGIAIAQANLLAQAKQRQVELEAARRAAEDANQSKSQFLANMSHELRTPLNAILGFSQLMTRQGTLDSEQRHQLGVIQNSGEHLLQLINEILDMSKIEAGHIQLNPSQFDLHHLLESIQGMFQLRASQKFLALTIERQDEVPQYIEADEGKLRQVLMNLLSNAIKFTEQGGITVQVSLDSASEDPSRSQSLQETSLPHLAIAVEDTGPGIASEDLETIFEAFVQTDLSNHNHTGTGLGLAISQKFVQMMGGQLQVESTLSQGSRFYFAVPITPVTPSAEEISSSSAMQRRIVSLAANQPDYRILVVDDRWESRQFLVELLKSVGFQVREAENGCEAIQQWQQWHPHLIWMDMRMPEMNGYEATERIKAHLEGQATVIIALTASALENEKSVILSAGCDDFVRKPFRESLIFEKISQYLGVEYCYEDASVRSNSLDATSLLSESEMVESLSHLAIPWRQALKDAVELADEEVILELLQELPPEQAALGQTLRQLIDEFQYGTLLNRLSFPSLD